MSEGLDKDRVSMSSAPLRLREHRGREDEKAESWRMGRLLGIAVPGHGVVAAHVKSQSM